MKIVFVLTRADEVGGAQIHVRDMASALIENGHTVRVAGGHDGDFASVLRERGVPFMHIRSLQRPIHPYRDMRAVNELASFLRDERPDLVSLHSSKAGLVGRLAARLAGVPAIFTAHGWAFTDGVSAMNASLYRWIERAAAPYSSRIITVSEFDRQLALGNRVGRTEQLVTVRNGMPDVVVRSARGDNGGVVRLVMVARFSPQKAHARLLRALKSLERDDWDLELIGGGEGRLSCESLVTRLGLVDQVRFSGEVNDVGDRLACADAYVLATNWEGLPRSIIEAMRAGLPVVANDVGGVRELVADGENGYLVARDDERGLAAKLSALIEDPDRRARMGEVSRRRYDEEFRFERMYEKTFSVYQEVIAEHV